MSQVPAAAPPDAPDPLSATVIETVSSDRGCIRCAYNLRGLPMTGVCPECGTPVADSLRGTLLQYASPEYLRTVKSGLSLVLNGILLLVVNLIATVFHPLIADGIGWQASTLEILLNAANMGITLLLLVGYWKCTEPDPGFVGQEKPKSARRVVRTMVLIQAVASVITLVLAFAAPSAIGGSAAPSIHVLDGAVKAVAMVVFIVQFFGEMVYMRWLAYRIPDDRIIRWTGTYRWLLPLITVFGCGIGVVFAVVLYWNLLDRLRTHIRSILAAGVPARLPHMDPVRAVVVTATAPGTPHPPP